MWGQAAIIANQQSLFEPVVAFTDKSRKPEEESRDGLTRRWPRELVAPIQHTVKSIPDAIHK